MYVLMPYKWNGGPDGTSGGNVTWTFDSTVPASFENDLQRAFTWSQFGNITFTEVSSGTGANIVFTYGPIDGPGNTAAVSTINSSSGTITSVSILIDNAEGWTEDANGVATSAFSNVRLSTVALHEVGHGIGMGHDTMPGSIMSPTADPNINTLQQNDIQGVQAKYGQAAVCFVTGARIRTLRGDVAVEDLQVGDLAVTASGAQLPIRWIGHREVDCAFHAEPSSTWPVRILAGAIGPGMPSRDLLVSPDHCLLFDDVLVPAKHLVNGATIRQEPVATVGYWHIELDRHEALLAEGLPAESYRDCGMHAFFDGAQEWGTRAVDAQVMPQLAPHALSGPRLHAIKAWLIARAKHLGVRRLDDPSLVVLADGQALTPVSVEQRRFAFSVPEGTRELVLRSRTSVPAHWIADNEDLRVLGVRIAALTIDGVSVPMDDARLSTGWNAVEANGRERWTAGEAHLPVCRSLCFTADWFLGYPVEAAPAALAEHVAVPLARPMLRLVANG